MQSKFLKLFNILKKDIVSGLSKKSVGKNSKGDITKYFDKYVENRIISFLKKHIDFTATIVSEELCKHIVINRKYKTAMHYIIIDPVDGSENYLNDIPFVCIGIAVLDENHEPLFSFTGNYYNGDYYYADRQKILYNGKPVVRHKAKNEFLIYTFSKQKIINGAKFRRFLLKFKSVRSMGATIGEIMLVLKSSACVFVDIRRRLTLENFIPFLLAAKHNKLIITDHDGEDIKITDLSLSKPYNVIVSHDPNFHKQIVKDLKGVSKWKSQ